ncbi:cyclin-K isoform X1 [Hydra vulgaris]|uniref:cyclin-K isoform X1 n=1 Tax=Hydra vulgaris TaxID=6087 RepID=UPI001F5F94AB|nr:cyclin-K [Hydra vulgaris]
MHWYHTTEVIELQTPSRNDGIDYETEARYRKEGARFIMELGNKLGLRYLTMATGIVFYHRFYMFHSFKEFSRWVTGASCLFLAGKVEETPKKCRDVLKVAQQSLSSKHFKTFGENPREEVMICERIILQTIKFDLQTNHPYQYLIKYGKLLKGEKSKVNELVQKAWIFINDSLSTTLCLLYKPQVIAIAVLLLAFKMSNQNIRDFISKPRNDWWKTFHVDATEADLEDICKELMNMYEGKPPRRRFPHKHSVAMKKKSSPSNSGSPKAKKQKAADLPSLSHTSSPSVVISATVTSLPSNSLPKKPVVSTASEAIQDSKQGLVSAKTPSVSTSSKDLERQKQDHQHAEPNVKAKVLNQQASVSQPLYPDQLSNQTTSGNSQILQSSTHQVQHAVQATQQPMPSHAQSDVTQKPVTLAQAPILDHMSSFFQSNPSYSFMPSHPFPQPPFASLIPPTFPQQPLHPPQGQQTYQQNNYQATIPQNQEYQPNVQQSQGGFQPINQHKQLNYQASNQQPPNNYQPSGQQNPGNYQATNQPNHNFMSQQPSHQTNFMNAVPTARNMYQNNSFCSYTGGVPSAAPPGSPFVPQNRMPQHVPPPYPPAPWLSNPGTPPANSNKPPWMQ